MGIVKIPIISFVKPKLLVLNSDSVKVKIKLRRRTKNHLSSMYFGALAVGADVTAGLHAYYFAEQSGVKVSFAFKSVQADFLKRATSDVIFESNEGKSVEEVFNEALKTKERINRFVNVSALNTEQEEVATFKMEISVKVK